MDRLVAQIKVFLAIRTDISELITTTASIFVHLHEMKTCVDKTERELKRLLKPSQCLVLVTWS